MKYSVNDKSTLVTIIALMMGLLGIAIPLSLLGNEISTNSMCQVMALYSKGIIIGSYQGKKGHCSGRTYKNICYFFVRYNNNCSYNP
jgi:hypothetical protein